MVTPRPARLDAEQLGEAAPHPLNWRKLLLVFSLLLPPATWSLQLALSYGLVYPAYDWGSKAALYLVTLASALVCALGAALGYHQLRRKAPPQEGERTHFLAVSACVMGIFFLLATLAQAVPTLLLRLGAHP